MAFALGKIVAVLVEEGVDAGGMVPEATTFVPWNRANLADSAPVVIRYLWNLRSKLSPPFYLEGDIPTARALAAELSGIASELESVTETLRLSSWHLASLAASVSGKVLTFPTELLLEVSGAYASLAPVSTTLDAIHEEQAKMHPPRDWFTAVGELPPLPALAPGHPLLVRLKAERDVSILKVRRAGLLLFRFGWPAEWKSVYPALRASMTPDKFKETFGLIPEGLL
jgi:hypothetical protein